MVKKIRDYLKKLKFNTILKLHVGVIIFNFLAISISNYVWPSPGRNTILSALVIAIIMPLVLKWYTYIRDGNGSAFKFYKWITIMSFVLTPFSYWQSYQFSLYLNDFSLYNPIYYVTQVTSLGLSICEFIYITDYWNRNYKKRS